VQASRLCAVELRLTATDGQKPTQAYPEGDTNAPLDRRDWTESPHSSEGEAPPTRWSGLNTPARRASVSELMNLRTLEAAAAQPEASQVEVATWAQRVSPGYLGMRQQAHRRAEADPRHLERAPAMDWRYRRACLAELAPCSLAVWRRLPPRVMWPRSGPDPGEPDP
jgi:hypothetical protein